MAKQHVTLSKEAHLDFLYEIFLKGISLSDTNIKKLLEAGYVLPGHELPKDAVEKSVNTHFDKVNHEKLAVKTEKQQQADSLIDIVELEGQGANELLISTELEERRRIHGHKFQGGRKIKKEDWMPESVTEHTQDFVNWIRSINLKGFNNKDYYEKFALYCQQAYEWLSEKQPYIDPEDVDGLREYRLRELEKCYDNTLYFLNKYIWYKEGSAEDKSGRIKYIARPNHEFMAYMHDAGYSMAIAKGRQQAATTTLMSLDVKDVIFKPNHFMKFICEDEDKTTEIFEDKLKYPFSQLPDWMRPIPKNERDNLFVIGMKTEKGKREGVNSKILIDTPKRTAIAGGAPQRVKIDEAGNIPILSVMIGNARPTMMWANPKTKKLEIKRTLWFWGTGGELEGGGKSFETEFMAIYNAFMSGDFSACIIPVFFDWTCRPFASQEDYDREFKVAKLKSQDPTDPKAKQHLTEFYQSWPRTLQDVFRSSAKTLVDEEFITARLNDIREFKLKFGNHAFQTGYFEPLYDESQPTDDGSDLPFKVIGVNFVPTSDIDPRASVTIFDQPRREFKNRYYQGTDPIDTDTGLSEFASAIFDKASKWPSAILSWRTPDYQQVFLQAMLLNMYYQGYDNEEVPELIESNRGTSYYQYLKNKGRGKKSVRNYELPDYFQNNSTINEGVGIDNKGLRNTMLVNKQFEYIKAYGDRNMHEKYWHQMSTFTCTITQHGKEVWGPVNKKNFRDDVLWATNFAYICSEVVYATRVPVDLQKTVNEEKPKFKYTRVNGQLTLTETSNRQGRRSYSQINKWR